MGCVSSKNYQKYQDKDNNNDKNNNNDNINNQIKYSLKNNNNNMQKQNYQDIIQKQPKIMSPKKQIYFITLKTKITKQDQILTKIKQQRKYHNNQDFLDDKIKSGSTLNQSPFKIIQQKNKNNTLIIQKQQIKSVSCQHSQEQSVYATGKNQQQQMIQQYQKYYQKTKYYYQQHDIDRAHQFCHKAMQIYHHFQNLSQKQKQNKNIDKYWIKEKLYTKQRQKLFKKVQKQYHDVISFNQQINKGGWKQQSDKKGVKVFTRVQGHSVGTLVQCVIQIPFEHFITVLTQIDLYQDYTPFMTNSRMEKDIARNCKLGYSANKFPLLTVRESFFQGIGYNRLQTDQTLFLFTRSIQSRKDLQQDFDYIPRQDPQAVSLIYKYFVVKYHPISRGKGRVVMAMNGDIQLSMVPMFLLNYLAVDFGNSFFNKVLDVSKKFKGSKWQAKIKEDSRLHDFFRDAIDNHLASQGM